MSKILHIVPGMDDVANGMVVVARLLAKEQGDAEVVDLTVGLNAIEKGDVEEVWVHGMWLPKEWRVCHAALRSGKRLVRMTHGSLSPVYLKNQSPFKKRLVSPIERYLLRKADKVVATCDAEADWICAYEPRVKSIEVTDLKRFFKFQGTGNTEHLQGTGNTGHFQGTGNTGHRTEGEMALHLLYLGRRHPLKGLAYLEDAVRQIKEHFASSASFAAKNIELKVVSNAFGEEKERIWGWCDILVLPTLSDNFGLVVAEALSRGKRVITTDGAPAWGDGNDYGGRLTYLRGYRNGSPEERIALLKDAIENIVKE